MDQTGQPPSSLSSEARLRRQLGIPGDAERVLVFSESSHWDPNWLYSSEEYYERFVESNLDQAIAELHREPRRVYSVECVFFLRLYWERRPGQRQAVRSLVNEGRLRLTSSGVTTADTLLPSAEAILRDLLLGQEWLRANGMTQEPRLAYFTDSFGCSPALPSLLKAAGFDRTAITRIDGMYFPGCDYELPSRFPRPGSSAERLLNRERSLDFVWQGPDGAEVLCHWNAYTYGQGDLLAHRGLSRIYLVPFSVKDRSDHNVARRIRQYVSQLQPHSRTPYLFCPIGMDFVEPIPDLVGLLDRYNRRHYPVSGVWAVNAGLDDYQDLVDCYRSQLPVLALDPNPYWTGFYTSRPSLKALCYELVDQLLLAERLALLPENAGADRTIARELADAWWTAAVANHHDLITGTSPDRVVEGEQRPWLERATAIASRAVERLTPPASAGTRRPVASGGVEWHQQDDRVQVQTPHYSVELAGEVGGGIVRAEMAAGPPMLAAVSNDLICYRDSGGLWRMGHEFFGGALTEIHRGSDRPAALHVQARDGGLEIVSESEHEGLTIRRRYWFRADVPWIRLRVEGRAAKRRTVTVRFHTGLSAGSLIMDQPGGVVVRATNKIYNPTFWPLQHFLHLQDKEGGPGLALWLRRPGAICYRPEGILEVVALRNATRERAFGVLPIPATPATGHERSSSTLEYAIWFTPPGDWREHSVASTSFRLVGRGWGADGEAELHRLAASVVTVDRSDVAITAVKPASRGQGLIVRLQTYTTPGPPVTVLAPGRSVDVAFLCDARERNLEPLPVRDGAVHLTMPGNIATVRLLS
ncbi:MAG: hypothetical protein P8189_19825 [Anaerolineae bacterium]